MSDEFKNFTNEYETYSWSTVWLKALTQPRVETFERLVRDPNASSKKAYGWVFICATIAYYLASLPGLAFGGLAGISSVAGAEAGLIFGTSIIWTICCGPITGSLAVLVLAFHAGITQLLARMLGGSGSYPELLYAFAAYTAPLSIISMIIYAIPIVNFCLVIPIAIFSTSLAVIAINAVNGFGWGKAVASAIFIPVVVFVLVGCFVIVVLALLGPQIGEVFSEIIRALETPVSTGV